MKVLVVDDDEKILKVLCAYLLNEGYQVETASDGWEAVGKMGVIKPDLVLLDVMLPGLDGWGVCREIRRSSDVPIIMLTARDGEAERINGLDLGADDYVTKPFSPKEIMARIRAICRRLQPERRPIPDSSRQVGPIYLNLQSHEVKVGERLIALTPTEYKFLELFLAQPGRAFSRLQLIEHSQGYSFEGYERTVDSHIKNLRKKLGDLAGGPGDIKTVYGVGYKLEGDSHA